MQVDSFKKKVTFLYFLMLVLYDESMSLRILASTTKICINFYHEYVKLEEIRMIGTHRLATNLTIICISQLPN